MVYPYHRNNGKGSGVVSLLVEHKSSPDKYMPVQVVGYLFSGYQQQIKQRQRHYGRQKWEYWTLDRLFDKLGYELPGFIPKFEYVYTNLRDTPDATVEALHNQFPALSLLC